MTGEDVVVKLTIKHLENRGWRITNKGKGKREHGVDIKGYRHGRSIRIKAKGDRKYQTQAVHNSFVTAIGQIVSRMEKRLKFCYYGIAIPSSWETTWRRKIKDMKYAWELLRLRVYLVHPDGHVEFKNWRKMLK